MNFNKDKLFFTGDTHFFHANCIKYDKRPFKAIDDMHQTIITNWNKKVSKDSVVFHLGDVAVGGSPFGLSVILNQLNGRIFLIKGNHDKLAMHHLCRDRFIDIKDYYELWVQDHDVHKKCKNKQLICLIHYPMACWNMSHYGQSWNVHGHSHGKFKGTGKQYDVGVPGNNYTPVSYMELKEIMNNKKPYDHVVQGIIDNNEVGDPRRDRVIQRWSLKSCPKCNILKGFDKIGNNWYCPLCNQFYNVKGEIV